MTNEINQESEVAGPATPTPDLTVSDLSALKSIIDVASERGTFKAAELELVGKVYNKLSAFLNAVTKKD